MATDDHTDPHYLWHVACEILSISDPARRAAGWPESLNIQQIAKLYHPDDLRARRAVLSSLVSALRKGDLVPSGTERVPNQHHVVGAEPNVYYDVPLLSRDTFRAWPASPTLPEESPLHGWVRDTGLTAEQYAMQYARECWLRELTAPIPPKDMTSIAQMARTLVSELKRAGYSDYTEWQARPWADAVHRELKLPRHPGGRPK